MLLLLIVLIFSFLAWLGVKKNIEFLEVFGSVFSIILSIIFVLVLIGGAINISEYKALIPELKSRISLLDTKEDILREKIQEQMKEQCVKFSDIESSTKELSSIVVEKEELQNTLFETETNLRWNANVGWLFHFNLAGAGKD